MSNIAPLSPLRRAYQLLQEGDKDGAKKLITGVLKTSPDNASAWYLASYLTDSPDKKLQALKRALTVDPPLAKLRGDDPLDELLSNGFSSASSSIRAERTAASAKSYTNAAVIVLVL